MDENGFYTIRNRSLDDALQEGDNVRVNQIQLFTRNTDTRSGNTVVRDALNTRIIIGLLPDGTYGIVISKPGFDVYAAYTSP